MSDKIIRMRCGECDGFLDIDKSRELLFCPFCGSKSLIVDSDAVKIVKDNNAANIKMHKMDVDLEIEKIRKGREPSAFENIIGMIVTCIIISFLLLLCALK